MSTYISNPMQYPKVALDRDPERGIVTSVPVGTPVTECSPLVITEKRTVAQDAQSVYNI